MWTRKALKTKAKASFRANYWKSVLVALIISAIIGVTGVGSSAAAGGGAAGGTASYSIDYSSQEGITEEDFEAMDLEALDKLDENADVDELIEVIPENDLIEVNTTELDEEFWNAMRIIMPFIILLVVLTLAVAIAIDVFLINPFEVGTCRFFVRNLNQKAEVKEIAYGYDHGYLQNAKTLFFRDIKLIGWTLLFIIPGIVKTYEYRMIPYLIAEDPTLTTEQAFAESRSLMHGNKWKAFVLDLSFIGWDILDILTLGILGVFYVDPYYHQTKAALYEALRYGDGTPDFSELPEA